MNWNECKSLILQDYNRKKSIKLKRGSFHKYFVALVSSESFKVSFFFRILTYLQGKRVFAYRLLYYPLRFYYLHLSRLTGIQLPIGTQVGGVFVSAILAQ